MGFFGNIFTRAKSVENPSTPINAGTLGALFSHGSKSGVRVDEMSTLGVPAFWRAMQILGGVIASLPFEVIEDTEAGRRVAKEHPVHRLISRSPSELYTANAFLRTMVVHYHTQGNFYALIRRESATGRPRELTILDPKEIDMFLDDRQNLIYKHTPSGRTFRSDRILHIPNMSWNGLSGLPIQQVHGDNIGLAIANRDYGATFYGNGAHISGVIKHPGRLTQEAYGRLRTSWGQRHSGVDKAGGTAILEEGMDYIKVGLNPAEAGFNDTKKATIADIALITGVPKVLLEDLDRATFSNIEHLSQQFVNYTITPLCETIEAEFNRKLFYEDEQDSLRTRFNFDGLLRGDSRARANYYNTMRNILALSPNEIRKQEGLNPYDGGDRYDLPLASNVQPDNNQSNEPDETTEGL